jgi:malic enzyme
MLSHCCTAVQGTAAVALAGLYGALRVLGKPQEAIAQQRIVCVGAGSAGMGVVRQIAAGAVMLRCCNACILVQLFFCVSWWWDAV